MIANAQTLRLTPPPSSPASLPARAPLPRASEAPKVRGLPWLGPSLALLRQPYRWWANQYQAHGPVYRFKLPTDRREWIAIAGREANELLAREGQHLFDQAATYPKAKQVLETEMHPSFTEGAIQRHLRRQVAPGFARQALPPHLGAMSTWLGDYVDRWKVGQSLRVTEETARMGLNMISMFATGEGLESEAASEAIRRYAIVFTGVVAMGWPLATMRVPRVAKLRDGLDSMIARRLQEHAANPPGAGRAPDYFDFLLRGTLPDGQPLPERERVVYGQIPFKNMGVYAGRVMNHVLTQLVQRPEVLERVQPEIDRVFGGGGQVTLEDLESMDLLRATIKETLRILPTAVSLQRSVAQPFEFGGHRFEAGDMLFTPVSVTHFLPEYFPEPDRFDIDRFMPDRAKDIPSYVYNPFGLGHHSCVARGVFEALTMMVIGTVLHRYRLEAPYELRTIIDALPGPWSGHKMRVVERRAGSVTPSERVEARPSAGPQGCPRRSTALMEAAQSAAEIVVEDGAKLFTQGDAADTLYFVIDGRLRMSHDRADARLASPASASAGDVVGELGILLELPRSATATAEGRVRLLRIDAELFARVVAETDLTAREIGALLLHRHAQRPPMRERSAG